MIQEFKAEYRISAPLVMAGHDALEKGDSLRPPSLKGALRFWWRALNWSRLRQQTGNDKEALKALHREESELFGSAAGKSQQAKVLLRVTSNLDTEEFSSGQKLESGLAYLLGQGMHDRNTGSKRPGLRGKVTLRCVWRHDALSNEQIEGLQLAVQALGLLGSLGARARKGFGSLSLQTLRKNDTELPVPLDQAQLNAWLKKITTQCNITEQPPFTAWYSGSRCWALPLKPNGSANSAKALLNEYGRQMMNYRLSDKSTIGGIHGRGLFKSDSRELRKMLENSTPKQAPRRAVFGLPNNVFFMDCKQTVEVNPATHQRRASPLLAHLHEFPNGQKVILATLLPAQFLPVQEGIAVKSRGRHPERLPFQPDWKVIEAFIQQCEGKELTV